MFPTPAVQEQEYLHFVLVLKIADVTVFFPDGDGLQEMAVIYSDRVVRSFRWVPSGEGDSPFSGRLHQVDKWQLAGQVRKSCSFCAFAHCKTWYV